MTDKEAYKAAVSTVQEAHAFLNLHRCINCEHYDALGSCAEHQTAIPDEYLYTPNDCPTWLQNAPF